MHVLPWPNANQRVAQNEIFTLLSNAAFSSVDVSTASPADMLKTSSYQNLKYEFLDWIFKADFATKCSFKNIFWYLENALICMHFCTARYWDSTVRQQYAMLPPADEVSGEHVRLFQRRDDPLPRRVPSSAKIQLCNTFYTSQTEQDIVDGTRIETIFSWIWKIM